MYFLNKLLLTLIFFTIFAGQTLAKAFDDAVIEKGIGGEINWQSNLITIYGYAQINKGSYSLEEAKYKSIQAAFKNAYKTYTQLIASLRVTADLSIMDMTDQDPAFKSELKNIFYTSQVQDLHVYQNGSSSLVLQIPIFGETGLAKTLFYKLFPVNSTINANVPIKNFFITTENITITDNFGFTGLIVDARNLKLNPCFAPQIIGKNNQLLLGITKIDFQAALQNGLTIYVKNLETAKKQLKRIGAKPLIVNAIEAAGPFKTNIILLNSDIIKIRNANTGIGFLEKCKVIVVI